MRVLMVSKALVTGVYQKKLEELAALPDIELLAVVPPFWLENRVGSIPLNRMFTNGYELAVEEMRLNGRHHVHYYPGLGGQIRSLQSRSGPHRRGAVQPRLRPGDDAGAVSAIGHGVDLSYGDDARDDP